MERILADNKLWRSLGVSTLRDCEGSVFNFLRHCFLFPKVEMLRDIGGFHFLGKNPLKVDILEEPVPLNVKGPMPQVPESLGEIMVGKVPYYALGSLIEFPWEPYPLIKYHLEYFVRILMHEGAPPHHHLIDEHPQTVPVDRLPMALIHDYLWSQVLRSAAQSVCPFSRFKLLDEAKVGQLEISTILEEHVLRLKISVDHLVSVVQVLEDCYDLSCIELGMVGFQLLHLLNQLKQLPTFNELHHDIE